MHPFEVLIEAQKKQTEIIRELQNEIDHLREVANQQAQRLEAIRVRMHLDKWPDA